jgi:hypothetical protein
MNRAPTPGSYEGFRGVVRRGTSVVTVGSVIELEPAHLCHP